MSNLSVFSKLYYMPASIAIVLTALAMSFLKAMLAGIN
jgi:hypothetical protein